MTPHRFIDANGYARVRVGPQDWRYEHRHVWEQAHGPIPEGFHVHHRNHVRHDNRLENLELILGVTHVRHHTTLRHATGQLDNRGHRSPRYRIDIDDAEVVRRRNAGESFRSIARTYGASHHTISNHYRRALEREQAA